MGYYYYPRWKSSLLLGLWMISLIYSIPNFFPAQPVLHVIPNAQTEALDELNQLEKNIVSVLQQANLSPTLIRVQPTELVFGFQDTNKQLEAKNLLGQTLGDTCTLNVNLLRMMPQWLRYFGAKPAKLGVDLSNGIRFTLGLEFSTLPKKYLKKSLTSTLEHLSQHNIPYLSAKILDNSIQIVFKEPESSQIALKHATQKFPELSAQESTKEKHTVLSLNLSEQGLSALQKTAIQKTLNILYHRASALGITEPVIFSQGNHQIVVDLPNMQDITYVQHSLAETTSLSFNFVQSTPSSSSSKEHSYHGQRVTLDGTPIITGDSIIEAHSELNHLGQPVLSLSLSKAAKHRLHQASLQPTSELIAVVYQKDKVKTKVDNKTIPHTQADARIIGIVNINNMMGNHFQISGLTQAELIELTLQLRAGHPPTPIYRIEQNIISPPSGLTSMRFGLGMIVLSFLSTTLFMGIYYQALGWISNLALLVNLSLLTAALSIIGVTVSLSSIAAILLTVTLLILFQIVILERIRESLRHGLSPQSSIITGYQRAWPILLDSYVTILIMAFPLFLMGSGPVKAFAITLGLGISTAILSAVGFARLFTHYFYGSRRIKQLSIGLSYGTV